MSVLEQPVKGELVRDVRIFRAGTFKNRTYTVDDLHSMVANFYYLREHNIFADPPARVDHSTSLNSVVGYIHAMRVDSEGFLVADVEFTEPDAYAKWERKTYRHRSLEVGRYIDNTGKAHEPVVWGLAFVDIPHVEGLSKTPDSGDVEVFSYITRNEETMATDTDQKPDEEAPEASETPTPDPVPDPDPTPPTPDPVPDPDPVATHSATPEVQTFRVQGQDTTDFAAVQAHITELETFRAETIQSERLSFVDSLADGNIITNPQAEKFRKLVATLTTEQFSDFKSVWEGQAPANLFAKHDLSPDPDRKPGKSEAKDLLQETVTHMGRSGFTQEQIDASPTIAKLRKDAGEDKE